MMIETLERKSWHVITESEAPRLLETDPQRGLASDEAEARRQKFGPNSVTRVEREGSLKRFFLQFHQPLIYVLLAAVVMTLLLREWLDAVVIFAVVLVNAVIGFIQESRAVTAIESLSKSLQSQAFSHIGLIKSLVTLNHVKGRKTELEVPIGSREHRDRVQRGRYDWARWLASARSE